MSNFNSILFSSTLGFHVDQNHQPTTNFQKQLAKFAKLEQRELLNNAGKRKKEFKKTKQIKQLVRKGIPNSHRGWMWARLANLDEEKISGWHVRRIGMSDGEVSFATRVNFTNQSITQAVKQISVQKSDSKNTQEYLYLLKRQTACKNTKQIDADIDRTFPEHPFFDLLSTRETMRRVLYAYQAHNKKVGYCQAMNFQAGILLLIYQDEEMTFHMLTKILDDYLPQDLYDDSMLGVKQDCYVLERLARKRLPRLYNHLRVKLDVDFSLFAANWFLCLCLNDFPIETALRIWDCFFSEGYKVLFRVGIAVLAHLEQKLSQCQNDGEVLMRVRPHVAALHDSEAFIAQIFSLRKFPKRTIIKYRKEFRHNVSKNRKQQ
mmetsp:Transcript_8695/g.32086  ORF Transcript_8695/g.32086 Transcript_8695/m.32086 type:complete len:376 (-) Transcript_8695:1117-2244(-)